MAMKKPEAGQDLKAGQLVTVSFDMRVSDDCKDAHLIEWLNSRLVIGKYIDANNPLCGEPIDALTGTVEARIR